MKMNYFFFILFFLISCSFVSSISQNVSSVGERWRILSGQNNWEGLLDPLDKDLRTYILHYEDLAQVARDAFNSEKASKYAGTSRYAKRNLFARVGFDKVNPFRYQVTRYFYATSSFPVPEAFFTRSMSREAWSKESNWMGFVAVATDEGKVQLGRRDIVISWRGAVQDFEKIDFFDFVLVPATQIFGDNAPMVGRGWYSIYTSDDPLSPFDKASARDQILAEVQRLVEQYKGEEISITVTSHSLGAPLAALTAVDIVYNVMNKGNLVTAFLSGSPKVGDQNFKSIFSNLMNLRALHVRNAPDLIPNYPAPLIYADIGVPFDIDTRKSSYLKNGDQAKWHHPEVYMHGVAGTQGTKLEGFELEVKRDISLVNKYIDGLKDEYRVPISWWIEKNKGMVQQEDGSWILMDHEEDDD
ncbi:PREDICTED: phospholipase A1-IIgamma-like [Nicotiana attenuata]|uniref:Phospholipase A1 n=1 Tax=Nicotiana attenuata TaxID=49451 RepID=A0A314KZB4_NICAT|nr:PREDICTED: phospholipase A1-IIgamma-like [Nicotiana attenuata]OIT34074.1 phospholipase a1-iigamma [Nicotiana attenuata]